MRPGQSRSDKRQMENRDLRPGWGWAERTLGDRLWEPRFCGASASLLMPMPILVSVSLAPYRIWCNFIIQVFTRVSCVVCSCQREVSLQAGNLKESPPLGDDLGDKRRPPISSSLHADHSHQPRHHLARTLCTWPCLILKMTLQLARPRTARCLSGRTRICA